MTDVREFLEALIKVQEECPLQFAETYNKSNHINFLTGKMMVYTKGKCSPEVATKVIKILVEEL